MTPAIASVALVAAIVAAACENTVLRPTHAATRLAFTVQPANVSANHSMTPAVEVTVQDDGGNTVPEFLGSVTVSLNANAVGGTLSGTVTRAVSNGTATFSDLSIDQAGSGYTLAASASGLNAARSSEFTVTCITNCWTAKAPIPTRRTFSAAGALNGLLYAAVRFRKPGRTTLYARAVLPADEFDDIRAKLAPGDAIERVDHVELTDRAGTVHAEVEKTLHIRRRKALRNPSKEQRPARLPPPPLAVVSPRPVPPSQQWWAPLHRIGTGSQVTTRWPHLDRRTPGTRCAPEVVDSGA